MENAPKGRVLIVEDETALRHAYARMLEDRGFSVKQAGDGEQAIEALATRAYDVILSDIAMPEMDGIQLLRELRHRDLDVPVILITGYPTVTAAVEAVEFGALQFLVKPIDAKVLVDAVGTAATRRRIAMLKREAADVTSDRGRPGDG
ncbi:MAG: response regulator [Proteobacteria bacterium]|jgi:DNA-binding NtrC family response regulator|nr:response regulator [Pseudomonadota bacterium]